MTTNLATLACHGLYITSDSVIIGDGTGLSIANIGSFILTSLPKPLLFTDVLHVPIMSTNLISVFALCDDNLINGLFFLLFLSGAGSSHGVTLIHGAVWRRCPLLAMVSPTSSFCLRSVFLSSVLTLIPYYERNINII